MKRGKHICETLKGVRSEIARANEINYTPRECHHEGDCAGTCPACESDMRWLEGQLRLRQSLGKTVTIAGLSLGVASLVSCNSCSHPIQTVGMVEDPNAPAVVCDTDSIEMLEGDVMAPPPEEIEQQEPVEIDGVMQQEDPEDNRDRRTR